MEKLILLGNAYVRPSAVLSVGRYGDVDGNDYVQLLMQYGHKLFLSDTTVEEVVTTLGVEEPVEI